MENYRPGVMDKLGLGYDVLKEINPRIIYAAVSGFGCYGPYHRVRTDDILAQAMGGMMSITGSKGGSPPVPVRRWSDILERTSCNHRHPCRSQRPHHYRQRAAAGGRGLMDGMIICH